MFYILKLFASCAGIQMLRLQDTSSTGYFAYKTFRLQDISSKAWDVMSKVLDVTSTSKIIYSSQ